MAELVSRDKVTIVEACWIPRKSCKCGWLGPDFCTVCGECGSMELTITPVQQVSVRGNKWYNMSKLGWASKDDRIWY